MPQVKIWGDGNAQQYVTKKDYDALHKLASEMAKAMEDFHEANQTSHCPSCKALAAWEEFNV